MEKKILTLFVVAISAMLFTSCSKDDTVDCKTCGAFITWDAELSDEDQAMLESSLDFGDVVPTEYCGEALEDAQQLISDMDPSESYFEAPGMYSVQYECQ